MGNDDSSVIFRPSESVTYKLLRHDSTKDIYYYDGGWWMSGGTYRELERDRFNKEYNPKRNNGFVIAPRANYETKEIELDTFILPHPITRELKK